MSILNVHEVVSLCSLSGDPIHAGVLMTTVGAAAAESIDFMVAVGTTTAVAGLSGAHCHHRVAAVHW